MRSKYRWSSLSTLVSKRIQAMRSSDLSDYAGFHGIMQECVCSAFFTNKEKNSYLGT